jgi:hypothetical protein
MAIALGRRVRKDGRSEHIPRARWLADVAVAAGLLGLTWAVFFGYLALFCPGSPGDTLFGGLVVTALVVVVTFAAPPVLGALAIAAFNRERAKSVPRGVLGTLALLGAGAAAIWAVLLTAVAGLAGCW